MKVDTPLTDDGPCDCGVEHMHLETVEQQSKLTGVLYNTIRCSICKTVFAAKAQSTCDCGGTPSGNHLQWCNENNSPWPPMKNQSGGVNP